MDYCPTGMPLDIHRHRCGILSFQPSQTQPGLPGSSPTILRQVPRTERLILRGSSSLQKRRPNPLVFVTTRRSVLTSNHIHTPVFPSEILAFRRYCSCSKGVGTPTWSEQTNTHPGDRPPPDGPSHSREPSLPPKLPSTQGSKHLSHRSALVNNALHESCHEKAASSEKIDKSCRSTGAIIGGHLALRSAAAHLRGNMAGGETLGQTCNHATTSLSVDADTLHVEALIRPGSPSLAPRSQRIVSLSLSPLPIAAAPRNTRQL